MLKTAYPQRHPSHGAFRVKGTSPLGSLKSPLGHFFPYLRRKAGVGKRKMPPEVER